MRPIPSPVDDDEQTQQTREPYESTSTVTGLVIGGVLLLVGAGAYWFWSRRPHPETFETFEQTVIKSPYFQSSNILF